MAGNKITRQDLADDKVFQIGTDYAKDLEKGIEANARLLKSFQPIKEAILGLNEASIKFKASTTNKAFLDAKKQEAAASKAATQAVKEQQAALVASEKAKQAVIETEKKQAQALIATERARKASLDTYQKEAQLQAANQKAKQAAIDTEARLIKLAEQKKAIEASNANEAEKKARLLAIAQQEKSVTEQVAAAKREQDRVEKALITTIERKRIATESTNRALVKEKFELGELNKRMKESAILSSKVATEYQKIEVRLNAAGRAIQSLVAKKQLNGTLTKKEEIELKRLQAEYTKYQNAILRADAAIRRHNRNVGNYSSALKGLGGTLRALTSAFGLMGGVYLFASAMRDAFKRVKDFDASMQNLAGVMRTSRGELKGLETDIKRVASTSVRTSNEVAKLAESLATLGKSKEEISNLLEPVVNLSIGLNASADDAGEFLIQMLNTFGKSTESAGEYADTIATIRSSTTLDFQKMRDSFQYLAPISAALNKDLAYTGSLVGILADNGLKAESAGRLLSTSMIKMATNGVSLMDALNEINTAVKEGKTEMEVLEIANKNFGAQAAKVGVILAKNSDAIEKNSQKIRENGGALDDLVEQQLESSDAKLKIFDSSYEAFVLSLESGNGRLSQSFKILIETASGFFNILTELNKTKVDVNMEVTNNVLKKQAARYKELGEEAETYANIDARLSQSRIDNLQKQKEEQERLMQTEIESMARRGQIVSSIPKYQNAIDKLNTSLATQEAVLKAANIQLGEYTDIITGEGSFMDSMDNQGAEIETIKNLQEQIAELNTDLLETDKTDIKVIRTKQEKIKVLQAELDAILGVSRGTKSATKAEADYIFEANKFINEQKLQFLKDFAADEKRDFDERQTALEAAADLELALAEYVQENKLKAVKKGSDQERLLLIQFEAERQAIIKRFEDATDNLAVKKLEENFKTEVAIQEQLLNEALIRENEHFKDTLSLYDKREAAIEAHEKRVADIKKKFGIEGLEAQIDQIQKLIDSESFSADERIRLEAKVSEYKKQISDLNTDTYVAEGEKRVMTEEEVAAAIIDISQELVNTIGDLLGALTDARIQALESELNASNSKFDKMLENEELHENERKRIQEAKQNAEDAINRKIAAEKRKQARLDKAMAVMNIGINTAVNISKVTPNPLLIALVAALGAVQLAAVAATPIPAYEKGTENHPGGFALVGEKRPEVIHEPGRDPYVISRPTVLDLPKRTKVTPSLEEYQQLMRASILASVESNNKKMDSFHTAMAFDDHSDVVDKLDEVKRAVSKIKQNVIFRGTKAPDIPFQMWKFNQTNWR